MTIATATRNGLTYSERISSMFGSYLTAEWFLDEKGAAVNANDISGNARNGLYVGSPSLAAVAGPRGILAPQFDGVNDKVNAYSASLAAGASYAEGGLLLESKIGSAEWADGVQRNLIYFSADASNRVEVYKAAALNTLAVSYRAGGVAKALTINNMDLVDWFSLAIRWSKSNNRVNIDLNGTPICTPFTGLGTWVGTFGATTTNIGSLTTGQLFKGSLAHVTLVGREVTSAESVFYSTVSLKKTISILGDSISAPGDVTWSYKLPWHYSYGTTIMINHAVSGASVNGATNIDAQVLASATDKASHMVIALGTNDDNAGDMPALQAKAEASIVTLRASNPLAQIYWMNVLPRWTNSGGATPVDKANIRTAIEAACTAQGITCWDTFTNPVITPAQTTDGLHLNNSGINALVDFAVARMT